MTKEYQVIRTLLGHQQMRVGLRCLPTLRRHSDRPVSFIVHDDGTLTEEDEAALAKLSDKVTVLWRGDADNQLEPLLANYPRCRAYRERHPLGLKLLDCALLSSGELAFCDSDILFIKPFANLFPDHPAERCVFMQDRQEAYALRPWHVFPPGKIKVPRQVNTGLIHYRHAEFDLDYVEFFLGHEPLQAMFAKRPQWIEQTCWAALGYQAKATLYDAKQIIIAHPKMTPLSEEVIAIHFVSTHRQMLDDFKEQEASDSQSGERATIRMKRARASNAMRVLISDLRKRL